MLFAIALFTVGVITIGYVLFDAEITERQVSETSTARFLAIEGLEVVRALRDSDFDNLTAGTYGLHLVDTTWELMPVSDTVEKFTRHITISDVDADTKRIESVVMWDITDAREGTVSLTSDLTDWGQTSMEAGNVRTTVGGATLTASGTLLSGVTIENTGSSDNTVTAIRLKWNNAHTMGRIAIAGVDVFVTAVPPGILSDTEIDITDVTLSSGAPSQEVIFEFDGPMDSSQVLLTFIMDDGSQKYTTIFL